MTLYSTLTAGADKTTVLATWAGAYDGSHSAKVTTFTDHGQAGRLADDLTRISEAMWDAAAWLDVYDIAEARTAEIIDAARGAAEVPEASVTMFAGCRHTQSWTADDLAHALSFALPQQLNALTRAQRLSVADELAADAHARAESLQLLPTGHDPSDEASRIWQAVDIGRATKVGLTGHLANGNGGAGWVVRVFDTDHGPAERWGARDMLHRLEQLSAAAKAVNARGGLDFDDFTGPLDHIVIPGERFGVHIDHSGKTRIGDDIEPTVASSALADAFREHARTAERVDGDAVLYIGPDIDVRKVAPWDRDVFAKINIELSVPGSRMTLATLEPTDTAGFVAALGRWASMATFRG